MSAREGSAPAGSLADYLRLVKFSHSVFALPFALLSAWVAAGGVPSARTLALVVAAAVAARTAAMAFNRYLDRDVDAQNPRTSARELPAGRLRAGSVLALALAASCVFVAAAFALNPLCGKLALPVLGVLLGYSATKRFTALAHGVLGIALGLAPLGAWLAVRGSLAGPLGAPLALAAAVATWVSGFDLIYACQDADFDRAAGLHSLPARYGLRRALLVSRGLHAATVLLWLVFGRLAGLGAVWLAAVGLAALLLAREHSLVGPRRPLSGRHGLLHAERLDRRRALRGRGARPRARRLRPR